jgi:hypothetical protein
MLAQSARALVAVRHPEDAIAGLRFLQPRQQRGERGSIGIRLASFPFVDFTSPVSRSMALLMWSTARSRSTSSRVSASSSWRARTCRRRRRRGLGTARRPPSL